MLSSQTVAPRTLAILEELMQYTPLNEFHLVGGTNLSLRYGYRMSIDLDFFCIDAFDAKALLDSIYIRFPQFEVSFVAKNTLIGSIDGVKIDFMMLAFPLLAPIETFGYIRLYSVPDIAAMKCSAILGRATKKDYWDISHLLGYYTIEQILTFFQEKYTQSSPQAVVRALTYMDDVEKDTAEIIALDTMTRTLVKQHIYQIVKAYIQRK